MKRATKAVRIRTDTSILDPEKVVGRKYSVWQHESFHVPFFADLFKDSDAVAQEWAPKCIKKTCPDVFHGLQVAPSGLSRGV